MTGSPRRSIAAGGKRGKKSIEQMFDSVKPQKASKKAAGTRYCVWPGSPPTRYITRLLVDSWRKSALSCSRPGLDGECPDGRSGRGVDGTGDTVDMLAP